MSDVTAGVVNVKIDVKDADKIIKAVSEEAFRWYKELSKGQTDDVITHRVAPNPHSPVVDLANGPILQVTVDQIDDEAQAFANRAFLGRGNAQNPLRKEFRVNRGPNVAIFCIRNSGSGAWRARFDIRRPGQRNAFFHLADGGSDTFTGGATISRFYILPFEAR